MLSEETLGNFMVTYPLLSIGRMKQDIFTKPIQPQTCLLQGIGIGKV